MYIFLKLVFLVENFSDLSEEDLCISLKVAAAPQHKLVTGKVVWHEEYNQ